MDPLELREKNWIKHEEFPFTTVAGLHYDSGNYEAATAKAKELFGYDDLRAEQEKRRERSDPVQLGIGISTFTEMCGLAPSALLGQLGYVARRLGARDRYGCCPPARSRCVTGTSPHGQGHETAGARSSPTGWASPSRTSRCCTATPRSPPRAGHLRVDGPWRLAAWRSLAAADKVIEKARVDRRSPARGQRRRPRVRGRKFSVQGHREGPGSADIAFAVFQGHDLPAGRRSHHSTPTRPSTPTSSRSRTARTCAPSRWTPRPARSRCATTSVSTTSAASSTR